MTCWGIERAPHFGRSKWPMSCAKSLHRSRNITWHIILTIRRRIRMITCLVARHIIVAVFVTARGPMPCISAFMVGGGLGLAVNKKHWGYSISPVSSEHVDPYG